jgi:hypothetical protein
VMGPLEKDSLFHWIYISDFASNIFCYVNFNIVKPIVVVEWLTLLLRIRKVPGLNLGSETGYPDLGFSWFSPVPPGKCWDTSLKLGDDCFLAPPLIHHSLITPSFNAV